MDASQRTAFEAEGYIVLPDVLSEAELHELNLTFDEHIASDIEPPHVRRSYTVMP
jgi:hypothetical protein